MTDHHVVPNSAYTFWFGPMPAASMLEIRRLMPTSAVPGSYGPSGTSASYPEWYATKRTSGWARAAGPKSAGVA